MITSAGDVAEGPWAHAGELVDSARQLVPAGEMIIVVHPSAHFLWVCCIEASPDR